MKSNVSPKRIASAAVWLLVIPAVVIAQALRGELFTKDRTKRS